MPFYQLQMTVIPTSNVLADAATNSWSCEADDRAAAELFKDAVVLFYQVARPWLAGTVRQNLHVWKIYDRADTPPRAPVSMGTWNFSTAPAGPPLPPEVAICCSFQGVPQSGVPQATRRGRIFLGPLDTITLDSNGRILSTCAVALAAGMDGLRTASIAAASWSWTIHSTTRDSDVQPSNGWVDDEFDTQRRRGRVPTSRTVFP